MRRRVGAEEAKVVIQRIPNKAKKKKFSRCSFRFPFTRRLDDDRLSPLKFCLLKKKILSLSLLFCRPPPHCVLKANNNTKR
jgi:hypothetical protein